MSQTKAEPTPPPQVQLPEGKPADAKAPPEKAADAKPPRAEGKSDARHTNGNGTSGTPVVAQPEKPWTVQDSKELYNVEGWGVGYFDVNDKGHVIVRPDRDRPDRSLDLFELAQDLEMQGIAMPVLLRFSDILRSRVAQLSTGFRNAIQEY